MNYFHTINIDLDEKNPISLFIVQILQKYRMTHYNNDEWNDCFKTFSLIEAEDFIKKDQKSGSNAIYRIIEIKTEIHHRGESRTEMFPPDYELNIEKFNSKEFYKSSAVR